MITQATIDKIFSAVRVEEVIGEYVQLKKTGSNFKGLSPFQDEKSPSFVVSPSKQIWKDFSSGKGGTAVSFLMDIENFTYPEALRFLAKKYGIEIQEDHRELSPEEKESRSQRENLYKVHEVANNFFRDQLLNAEEGQAIGLSYFHERGLSDEIIGKFQLGYSPTQKDAFTSYALEKGYSKDLLEHSGLSIFPKNLTTGVDRFRERVIYPILSFSGRVLGFGARILKNDVKTAKYLNSPETDIYHKSSVLYGIAQSKRAIAKEDHCLLVEGYMDVISFHQAGIENVVASSGTSLTEEQVKLIKRLTPNVTVMYDGDAPGIKASFRSIDMLLKEGMNIKLMLFPDGHDPDSFSKAFSEEYVRNYIAAHSVDFIQFKIDVLGEKVGSDPFKRGDLVREVVKSIAIVPNRLQKEILIQEAAKLLDISERNLYSELQIRETQASKIQPRTEQPLKVEKNQAPVYPEINPLIFLEGKLVDLMLKYGDREINKKVGEEIIKTTVIEEVLHHFSEDNYHVLLPLNQKIIDEIREGFQQHRLLKGDFFLTLMDEDLVKKATDTLLSPYQTSNWSKHNIYFSKEDELVDQIVQDVELRHKREFVMQMIRDLQKESSDEEVDNKEQTLQRIMILNQLRIKIDQEQHRVL